MSMTPSRRQIEAYKLRHAAEEGRLVVYHCRRCRTEIVFMATDLVKVWNPDASILLPPAGGCHRCHGVIKVEVRLPTSADVGTLRVRRPAGVRTTQLWKWGWYG
jgi:hypothetical protein